MEKLITSEHLSNIKFAADCAIKEPDSIYSQEFFMLLDETFGSKGDYESPTQAVAVAWLINRVNELEQRAEAAEAQQCQDPECHTDFMPVYKEMVVRGKRAEAAEAQLAELAKQKPVAWCPKTQIDLLAKHRMVEADLCSEKRFDEIPLFTRAAPAAVPVDLVPDDSDLAERHTAWLNTLQRPMFSDEDWEELSLYTWLAFRDSFRAYRAEIQRRIEERQC